MVYEIYDMETGVAGNESSAKITYTENTRVEERALEGGKMQGAVVGESRNMLAM